MGSTKILLQTNTICIQGTTKNVCEENTRDALSALFRCMADAIDDGRVGDVGDAIVQLELHREGWDWILVLELLARDTAAK